MDQAQIGRLRGALNALKPLHEQAVKDPDFLVDAGKANLEVAPASGEEIEQAIASLFKTPPAVVAKLKEILK